VGNDYRFPGNPIKATEPDSAISETGLRPRLRQPTVLTLSDALPPGCDVVDERRLYAAIKENNLALGEEDVGNRLLPIVVFMRPSKATYLTVHSGGHIEIADAARELRRQEEQS